MDGGSAHQPVCMGKARVSRHHLVSVVPNSVRCSSRSYCVTAALGGKESVEENMITIISETSIGIASDLWMDKVATLLRALDLTLLFRRDLMVIFNPEVDRLSSKIL